MDEKPAMEMNVKIPSGWLNTGGSLMLGGGGS